MLLHKAKSSLGHIKWWFQKCRNVGLLVELSQKYPKIAEECVQQRTLLLSAIVSDLQKLNSELQDEEILERQKDREIGHH